MVKGNSRQVIVVKSPDPRLFEQAIFLLKEDAVENGGVSPRELLEEAQLQVSKIVAGENGEPIEERFQNEI